MANPWLTPTEVLTITRATVAEADILSAIGMIEMVTGRDLSDPTSYSTPDQRALRYAIAWQAAYIVTHPDLATQATQPGVMTESEVGDVRAKWTVSQDAARTPWLSPLTRTALNKVSWRGKARTLVLGRLRDRVPSSWQDGYQGDLLEEHDPETGWTPLPVVG